MPSLTLKDFLYAALGAAGFYAFAWTVLAMGAVLR